MGSASYLADLGNDLLTYALQGLAETRTGVVKPAHVFLAWGDPVADLTKCCSDDAEYSGGTLTVQLGGPTGDPLDFSPLDQHCQMLTTARFTITLLRCYPGLTGSGEEPDAAELNVASRQRMIDLWCLVTYLRQIVREGTWAGIGCNDTQFTDTTIIEPSGGCSGFQLTLTAKTSDNGPDTGS